MIARIVLSPDRSHLIYITSFYLFYFSEIGSNWYTIIVIKALTNPIWSRKIDVNIKRFQLDISAALQTSDVIISLSYDPGFA